MRRPDHEHTALPWRVHELACDFRLLDVWRFPLEIRETVPLEDFLALLQGLQRDLVAGPGLAGRLFRLRGWLGERFGWDRGDRLAIPGTADHSLRERLSEADRAADLGPLAVDPARGTPGFDPVYRFHDEALAEISNRTVHALMHIGREPIGDAHWAPQMSIYVKARGAFGRVYMALIDPFRHAIVYPAMMRAAARAWPTAEARRGC
jgi:hypothetical protein